MVLPQPGSSFGRYDITSRLGRGGMGVVFAAVHRDLDRPVALKLLSPELSDSEDYRHRFLREAKILARLDSPHVVRVHDAGDQDGWLYIATDLVAGGDLGDHLRTHGPFAPSEAARLVAQVADGLAAAHEQGILHRDVKPSNVLGGRGRDGRLQAILCDLGISVLAGSEHTRTGGVLGTLGYLAPERHEGRPATVASDVYAVGCLLWATLTGAAPYTGTDVQVALGHLNGAIPQLPDDQDRAAVVNDVLRRSMAKDPTDRFESAHELRAAVAAIAEPLPPTPIEATRLTPVPTSPGAQEVLTVEATLLKERATVAARAEPSHAGDASVVAPGDRRRRRSRRVVLGLVAGLLVVAAVPVAVVVASSGNGDDDVRESPSTGGAVPAAADPVPSTSAAASGRSSGIATYTCWDGTTEHALATCRRPRGMAGLRWTFPGAPLDSCTRVDETAFSGAELAMACTFGSVDVVLAIGSGAPWTPYCPTEAHCAEIVFDDGKVGGTYEHERAGRLPERVTGLYLEYPILFQFFQRREGDLARVARFLQPRQPKDLRGVRDRS